MCGLCKGEIEYERMKVYLNSLHLNKHFIANRSVVVVIVWQLDLQLPRQSVTITANVVSSNPTHCEVYSIQHYVIKYISHLQGSVVFFGNSGFLHQSN